MPARCHAADGGQHDAALPLGIAVHHGGTQAARIAQPLGKQGLPAARSIHQQEVEHAPGGSPLVRTQARNRRSGEAAELDILPQDAAARRIHLVGRVVNGQVAGSHQHGFAPRCGTEIQTAARRRHAVEGRALPAGGEIQHIEEPGAVVLMGRNRRPRRRNEHTRRQPGVGIGGLAGKRRRIIRRSSRRQHHSLARTGTAAQGLHKGGRLLPGEAQTLTETLLPLAELLLHGGGSADFVQGLTRSPDDAGLSPEMRGEHLKFCEMRPV